MVFWAAAFLLFFWALGDRGLWTSEGRWAEITRDMFLTRDFFHPAINGESYFDKPLLTYWLVALVSAVTGRLNEWTLRLPSAISGLLALWATTYLGRKLWSREVGRTAGWILLTTYGFLFWGRTATADMENLAAIILAVAWYWKQQEKPNFSTYLVFYLICFLGAHTKGLTALVVPVLVVFTDLFRERRWRAVLTRSHVLALAIGGAVYLAPFIYSSVTAGGYQESGLALVFQENLLRYFQPFDHKEPFYVYFCYLPELFLPWTPLLFVALWGTFTSLKRLDRRTRWLVETVIVMFLFFTCSGSRRSYYILPILPFCALLTSVFLNAEEKGEWKRLGVGLQARLFGMASLIEILSPVIWPIIKEYMGFVPPRALLVVTPILGILALFSLLFRYIRPGLLISFVEIKQEIATLVATATILMGGFFCVQQASLEAYDSERLFVRELKAQIAGLSPSEIAFYRGVSPKVLFYLDLPGPMLVLKYPDEAQNFLESESGVKVLVSRRKYLNDLLPALPEDLREEPTLSEKIYPRDKKGSRKLLAWKIMDKNIALRPPHDSNF